MRFNSAFKGLNSSAVSEMTAKWATCIQFPARVSSLLLSVLGPTNYSADKTVCPFTQVLLRGHLLYLGQKHVCTSVSRVYSAGIMYVQRFPGFYAKYWSDHSLPGFDMLNCTTKVVRLLISVICSKETKPFTIYHCMSRVNITSTRQINVK